MSGHWWLTTASRAARKMQDTPRYHHHSWSENDFWNPAATCMQSFNIIEGPKTSKRRTWFRNTLSLPLVASNFKLHSLSPQSLQQCVSPQQGRPSIFAHDWPKYGGPFDHLCHIQCASWVSGSAHIIRKLNSFGLLRSIGLMPCSILLCTTIPDLKMTSWTPLQLACGLST